MKTVLTAPMTVSDQLESLIRLVFEHDRFVEGYTRAIAARDAAREGGLSTEKLPINQWAGESAQQVARIEEAKRKLDELFSKCKRETE